MYKALYRKYRPDTFEGVVGQTHIVQTLKNAIKTGKVAHAYLFHGPRGTGKTSLAKIFAAAINCEKVEVAPCHECRNCRLIDAEQTADIVELDAASNNGVDEIRLLREYVRYAPTDLAYKVYIIDEVHMLSMAAFNALLKTLEEPPMQVVFILATTEVHKIPQTIISRTQRFDFKKIAESDIKMYLKKVAELEGVHIEDDACSYLATYASGGMRDALSLLDQVITYQATDTIDKQAVLQVVGTSSDEQFLQLISFIKQGAIEQLFYFADEVRSQGKNIQVFIESFLYFLQKKIMLALKEQNHLEADNLLKILQAINEKAYYLRQSFLPDIAFQSLLLEVSLALNNSRTSNDGSKVKEPDTDTVAMSHNGSESVSTQQLEDVSGKKMSEKAPKTDDANILEDTVEKHELQADESTDLFGEQGVISEETLSFEASEVDTISEKIPDSFEDAYVEKEEIEPLFTFKRTDNPSQQEEVQVKKPKLAKPYELVDASKDQEKIALKIKFLMAQVMLDTSLNQNERVKRRWHLIQLDIEKQITAMLLDMEPKLATDKVIVLTTYNRSLANQMRLPINFKQAQEYLADIMDVSYELLITDEATWLNVRNEFSELWKQNQITNDLVELLEQKLCDLEEFETSVIEEDDEKKAQIQEQNIQETSRLDDEIVTDAVELFGADIVEVKE